MLVIGQMTHGPGTEENPSVPLHSTKDIKGRDTPQNIILVKKKVYVNKDLLDPKPVAKSKEFLEHPEVKANLDKLLSSSVTPIASKELK